MLIIIGWSILYIISYVPNSKINTYIELQSHNNSINKQNKINKEILNELNSYKLIDSLYYKNQGITFYFNEENKKIIIETDINNEKNYNIINSIKKDSHTKTKINKYNSDIYFKLDIYDNLSLCFKDECYYTYSNCKIKDNSYNYSQYLSIYNSDGNSYNPIKIYIDLVKESIKDNQNIYYLNDNRMINIEKTENGIAISNESKIHMNPNQGYSWVILKNGEIILNRICNSYNLVFEQDLTQKSFYADKGNYEIYLETASEEMGYIKISNSIYWTNN